MNKIKELPDGGFFVDMQFVFYSLRLILYF
jgi:hypothetical protein